MKKLKSPKNGSIGMVSPNDRSSNGLLSGSNSQQKKASTCNLRGSGVDSNAISAFASLASKKTISTVSSVPNLKINSSKHHSQLKDEDAID
jgi:hypothetical protein